MAADFTSTVEVRKIPSEHMRNGRFLIPFSYFSEEDLVNMQKLTGLDIDTLRQLSQHPDKDYVNNVLNDAYYRKTILKN